MPPTSSPRWFAGRLGPLGWFSIVYILVFGIRSITTLLAENPGWEAPGTGWRSTWQLIMVAVLVIGLIVPSILRYTVGFVTAIYVAATISELFNGEVLVGIIPVDERDRWVHPLVAGLGIAALIAHYLLTRRRSVT